MKMMKISVLFAFLLLLAPTVSSRTLRRRTALTGGSGRVSPPDGDWNTLTSSSRTCTVSNPGNQCEASCTKDDECKGELVCQTKVRESKSAPVPGCVSEGLGKINVRYCYHPDPVNGYVPADDHAEDKVTPDGCEAAGNCPKIPRCKGNCAFGAQSDFDSNCESGLTCLVYSTGGVEPWECDTPAGLTDGVGYCVGPSKSPTMSPTTAPPTASPRPTTSQAPSKTPTTKAPTIEVTKLGELVLYDQCPGNAVDPVSCPVCTGPCTQDSDCEGEQTKCMVFADGKNGWIQGCDKKGVKGENYCYDPFNNYTSPELLPPDSPVLTTPYFNNEMTGNGTCDVAAANPEDPSDMVVKSYSGAAGVGGGSDPTYFRNTTYIYVVDRSLSTKEDAGACGDSTGDTRKNTILDCEILAIEEANKAAIEGGNVDLVGLVLFNNRASKKGTRVNGKWATLFEPWYKSKPQLRDPEIVDMARTASPWEGTNFEEAVQDACELARSSANDNGNTIVIFVSDGRPNMGQTSKATIQNNCAGAIFQTYAVTEGADCDAVDPDRPLGSFPDTLREIAEFSGGACTKVTDVTKLPETLKKLDATQLQKVTPSLNGQPISNITFDPSTPPFDGPKDTAFSGFYSMGPGNHKFCTTATKIVSGVPETLTSCREHVVLGLNVTSTQETVVLPDQAVATFKISLSAGGEVPICGVTVEGKEVTVSVETGPNTSEKVTVTLDPNGEATFNVTGSLDRLGKDTVKACYEDPNGFDSCDEDDVEWTIPDPSSSPSVAPSSGPSVVPSGLPSIGPSVSPSKETPAPSSVPSGAPSTSFPSGSPSALPSVVPGHPTVQPSLSLAPSVAPSGAPSSLPSQGPSSSLSALPSSEASSGPSSAPSILSSSGPSVAPSSVPSSKPSTVASALPSQSSEGPSAVPSALSSGAPSAGPSAGPSAAPSSNAPSSEPSALPSVVPGNPTVEPTLSLSPSAPPSGAPSGVPSIGPTGAPSGAASGSPSAAPSGGPSVASSTGPSASPSAGPSSDMPSGTPSAVPSVIPGNPTVEPSVSLSPSGSPSISFSKAPSTGPSGTPIQTPSATPSGLPSGKPSAMTMSPSSSPSAPLQLTPPVGGLTFVPSSAPSVGLVTDPLPPTDYCEPLPANSNTCTASESRPFCRPYRQTDHCAFENNFLFLVSNRKSIYSNNPLSVRGDGYWYDLIDDKLGGKLFAEEENIASPALKYCSANIQTGLDAFTPPASGGFVIKAVGFHSNKGVFVLPEGFGGIELLSGNVMGKADVQAALVASQATRIVVEDYVSGESPGTLPDEYKFHMFNGTVGSIVYVSNPGTPCACFAELDPNWNRIDGEGCFSGGNGPVMNGQCIHIVRTKRYPTQMKGMDLCSSVPAMNPSLLANLTTTAQAVSQRVGVYMRVDMFVSNGMPVVSEFTAGHTGGKVHCSAPVDQATGCVDSCYLGKLWKSAGGPLNHGGPSTSFPISLTNFTEATWDQACAAKMASMGSL